MRGNVSVSEKERIAESLLNYIRLNQTLTVEKILSTFSISLTELLNHIQMIKSWGYDIKNDNNSVTFISAPDALIDSEISYCLQTKKIGSRISAFQSVISTNETAATLAEQGADEGTIVVAEKQTKGKGRFGRHWHSIEKKGIYCSLILRPSLSPEFAPGLSLMTAAALADTFSLFTQAKVQIKWPNDILLNGKKTAGILTELSADKNKINHVIVGVGININHTPEDFPVDLLSTATSLCIENREKVSRVEFLQKFLGSFENAYECYKTDRLKSMHTKLRNYSSLLDSEITLSNGKKVISGKVVDINKDGALVLELDGNTIVVNSGEVTVVKK